MLTNHILGWEHKEKLEQHESQKDYKTGFGGQFGVQRDRVDKAALGWEEGKQSKLRCYLLIYRIVL